MSFLETASKCLKCPAERVGLVEDSSRFDPSTIRDGVVIFFAEWSAPAHVALKSVTEKLPHLKQDIPVWILNLDTLTTQIDYKFHGAKHGNGETFFFRGGVQIDRLLYLHGDHGENFRFKCEQCFGNQ